MALKSFAELLRRAAEYARRGLSEVEARVRNRRPVPAWEPAMVPRRGSHRRGFGHRPFGYWQRAYFHSCARGRRPKGASCPFQQRILRAHKRFFSYVFRGGFYSNLALCKSTQYRGCVNRALSDSPPVWMASLFGQNHTQLHYASRSQVRHQTSLHHVVSRCLNEARVPSLIRACGVQSSNLAPSFPALSGSAHRKPVVERSFSTLRRTLSLSDLYQPWTVSLAVAGSWPKPATNDHTLSTEVPGLPPAPGIEATTAAVDFDLSPAMVLPSHANLDNAAADNIVSAIEAQIARLQTIIRDVRQTEGLGELPLSVVNDGRTLRVHFNNSNAESVALLMQDQEITTGNIVELPSENLDLPPIAPFEWQDSGNAPQLSFSISTASTVSESFSLV